MKATDHQIANPLLRIYLHHALEVLWLIAALAVPLVMAPQESMIYYVQLPKVALLRILVALMAALWMIEWLLFARERNYTSPQAVPQAIWDWLREEPTRWILVASGIFIGVYILSTVLSASVSTSVWGSHRIWDGYSLYNVLTYYTLFLVIATHMRTRPQLWRLLGMVAAAGGIGAFLGILEQQNLIAIGSATFDSRRVESTFGNPIFFGSFLTMTIPLTIGLALVFSQKLMSWKWLIVWIPLVSLQLLALALTISRGPMFALAGGLVVFIVVGLFTLPRRDLAKITAVILICSLVAFSILKVLPDGRGQGNENISDISGAIEDRIFKSYPEVTSGGISSRGNIWKSSAVLITEHPWLPFAGELSLSPLRSIIGYGPELYGYVYPLEAEVNSGLQLNAHNLIIHQAVELGYLGALSYMSLLAAVFLSSLWVMWRRRQTLTIEHKYVLIALFAAFAGRTVEQMVGVARVGDITLFWIALAIVAALPTVMNPQTQVQTQVANTLQTFPTARIAPRFALALIVVIGLFWTVAAKNINYLRADVKAANAFASNDIDEAIEYLDGSVSLAPDIPIYYRRRAETLKQHMNGSADVQYRAQLAEMIYADRFLAAQIDPLAGESLFGQANAALDLNRLGYDGKGQEAAELYQNLIDLAPGLTEFQIILQTLKAIAYVDSGQSEKALEVLDELLALNPDDAARSKAFYIQGAAHYEIGNVSETIDSLEASLIPDADVQIVAQSHLLLARVYGDMGESALAEYHAGKYEEASNPSEG